MDISLRREWWIGLGAAGLALVAALALWLLRPERLTISVGPRDGLEAKLFTAFAAELDRQRADVRLTVDVAADYAGAAERMRRGAVDLAVVRPDIDLPVNALTVTVLREEAALLFLPSDSKIASVDELAGRPVGLFTTGEADRRALRRLLDRSDLHGLAIEPVDLAGEDPSDALASKRVEAILALAPPAEAARGPAGALSTRSFRSPVKIIGLGASAAAPTELAWMQQIDIAAGSLGGRPRQPEEDIATAGVSYRLVARADLDRAVVAALTAKLFETRARLARQAPVANTMKGLEPDGATASVLPNHPGAIDYFAREEKTFFERYGDLVYLAMFVTGGLGSAMGWLRQRLLRKRREQIDDILDELLALLGRARGAPDEAELDGVVGDLDRLVATAVAQARERTFTTRTMGALMLAIESARAAIAERRASLASGAMPRAKAA